MNREEFLNELQEYLSGRVEEAEITESLNYYRDYFREEMMQGKSEEEIIASLGSPRLIAHSIVDAHEEAEKGAPKDGYYDAEDASYDPEGSNSPVADPLQGMLAKAGLIIGLVALLVVVFTLLRVLFPFILVAVLVGWIYNMLFRS